MLNRAIILTFRVRRKLARELRKRITPALVSHDLRCLETAIQNTTPRQCLVDYAQLFEGSQQESLNAWLSPDETAAILSNAELACRHQFDLLGSGLCDLGDRINWHLDFKTGFQWPPTKHHLCIQWDQVPDGTDIKVPWELSRCQHFASLGLADRISGDEHYYIEFKTQVLHWIESNPCGFGVNWVCAMDVAIRAVSWLSAVVLFRHRIENDKDGSFHCALVNSLWLHGQHISRNLEWQGPKSHTLGNHFVADICGLLAVGALFRNTAQGRNYLDFAHRWFESEICRQTHSDGANFETSTSYHRLAFEMFLWADTLAQKLDEPFSEAYRAKLQGMASFVKAYTSPSGNAAQFGDNDSGRLLTAGIDSQTDHRYLTDGECGFGGRINRFLLRAHFPMLPTVTDANGTFPRGGYWFTRSGDAWLGVRAGAVSHGGAHAHCDQLSFVLAVGCVDFIVDSGTGTYSASVAKRNHYRSTGAHNACHVNDWESNLFADGKLGLFRMSDDTRTEVINWDPSDGSAHFTARHQGYHRHRNGTSVQRSILMLRDALTVTDTIDLLITEDRLNWSFQFAPGIRLQHTPDGIIARSAKHKLAITAEPLLEYTIEKSSVSPGYGMEVEALCLRMTSNISQTGSHTQKFHIHWTADSHPDERHNHP
jgi:hypothetical protein